jgi:M6 family metalloprotease-like protein
MLPKRLIILTALIWGLATALFALVPPVPAYNDIPAGWHATKVELPANPVYPDDPMPRQRTIPNNILVLRVQFTDVTFSDTASYPDYLIHDYAFFDRWMLHLADFFGDASHYQYTLNYTLHPQVVTLPRTMSYYGADGDESIDEKVCEMAADLVAAVDDDVDFTQYGGMIIFHAGSGQESDIDQVRTDQIWSTFLTRKVLQAAFDPDNNNYPGLLTSDGTVLTNIVIVPESEYQDYFPGPGEENADAYLFSIYGVLAHQFGHLIGLPTLFDNDSSNGVSQGIGNWGLMGTGVWNASGYVPAQVSPWCRYYLGWEEPITLSSDASGLIVDHFLDHDLGRNRLYKIPISANEYFLVENRQQNPDASLDPYSNMPSYTFKLLPEGEQDYYENYPLLPFFNFMENRYAGSEWDFFLPGLGGPTPIRDGSGILIWHIDEYVIAQNFTANFDKNRINGFAPHKGVDVEEADGIQHLDTGVYSVYKWGSPDDTFREGNNNYFGELFVDGIRSLPTSESYYGGIPLEIYDISTSGNQMTFSVRFGWRLQADYSGPGILNACIVDIDADGEAEIVQPLPNGKIFVWKDEQLATGFPVNRMPITQNYVWDGSDLYIPMQQDDLSRLYAMDSSWGSYVGTFVGKHWAHQPIDAGAVLYLALNDAAGGGAELLEYDKQLGTHSLMQSFDYDIVTNMVLFRDHLSVTTKENNAFYRVWEKNLANGDSRAMVMDVPVDSTLVGIFRAPLATGAENGDYIAQCLNSLYVFDEDMQLMPGFPVAHDLRSTAPLTLADWDGNGSLDIVLASDNGFAIFDHSGSLISRQNLMLAATDTLSFSSGAMVMDLDNDGLPEITGNFKFNRLNIWEHDYKVKADYPKSFSDRSRRLPVFGRASDGQIYAWVSSDDGAIFRGLLPNADLNDLNSGWFTEYADLSRTASLDNIGLVNQYQSTSVFVPGEVYIYPSPLKAIYGSKLTLSVMTNRDTPLDVRVYDISGTLVFSGKGFAKAYLRNRDVIEFPAGKLASGVYITVVKTPTESTRIKFAVEK